MSDTFAYDVIEYPSYIHPQMHPSRLAAIARLHGISAADPANCRLLEVGCGDGLQLLSLAQAYPDSHFVGVDMSVKAIARGESMRRTLALDNVQLVAADLMTWDPGTEQHDYVVAHGFFSWVPRAVRERLLALCNGTLAPAGLAYVSYNALPGCHLRRMMGDMMRFHVSDITDPAQRIEHATMFLNWLGGNVLDNKGYADLVRIEAVKLLTKSDPSVIFHDDLADINQAFSISEFDAFARAHNLQFLAEADYNEMSAAMLPQAAADQLALLANEDVIRREQYLDFLKGRRFRQTLLCRDNAGLQRSPKLEAILEMDAEGQIEFGPAEGVTTADHEESSVRFWTKDGAIVTTNDPVAKGVLLAIGRAFPAPISVRKLLDELQGPDSSPKASQRLCDRLTGILATCFQLGLVQLHSQAPQFARVAGDRPCASILARLALQMGGNLVASLKPSIVRIDSVLARELILSMDGTRDRHAIKAELASRMAALEMPEGTTPHDLAWWQNHVETELEAGLEQAAKIALLMP